MKIQIDTELLINQNITLDQYFIIKCLYDKDYDKIFNIYLKYDNSIIDNSIYDLEKKGFIKNMNDEITSILELENIHLKQKAKDLFFNESSFFDTFWSIYPIKVGNGNNLRILKSKDANTLQGIGCKKKLELITKHDPQIEANILKGLNNELILRKKTNTMNFFQLIETYLHQRTWEKYVDLDEEEDNGKGQSEDI
jgi:hypothetical protein